jgi:hypothetical protein
MTYFGAIQREHILDAFTEVLQKRMHGFGEPVRFFVEHRGHRYPAKAVLGIAREFATGEQTGWNQFHGSAKLKPTFRRLGFTFVNADD